MIGGIWKSRASAVCGGTVQVYISDGVLCVSAHKDARPKGGVDI